MIRRDSVQMFLPGLYPVGALLILAPLADVLAAAWPLRVGEAAWRFGAFGLEFQAILLQVLGFALLLGTSALLGQRALLRGVSVAALLAAIGLCFGVTRFVMDYRELHGLLDQAAARFDSSAFRAVLSAVLAVPVLTSLGGRGFVASGEPSPEFDEALVESRSATPGRRDAGGFRSKQVIPFPRRRSQPGSRQRI